MKKIVMTCGHMIRLQDKDVKIRCERCGCDTIWFRARSVYDHLEGRVAVCGDKKVPSRWDLPGFVYRQDLPNDLFNYGVPELERATGSELIDVQKERTLPTPESPLFETLLSEKEQREYLRLQELHRRVNARRKYERLQKRLATETVATPTPASVAVSDLAAVTPPDSSIHNKK